MPWPERFVRRSAPERRSKAAVMIGSAGASAGRSVEWARNRLSDIDPRTRANAVEALWGNDTAYVRALLRTAARDSNNRVAGNALFALYSIGEMSAIQDLLKLASSEVPRRRASAAWVMGETGDKRFADVLGVLTGDTNATVRKRAFAALELVRNAAAKARMGTEWRVIARVLPSLDGARQIALGSGTRRWQSLAQTRRYPIHADRERECRIQVPTGRARDTRRSGHLVCFSPR